MCCGSGCIGVALARLGNLRLTAADISPACLELTHSNALRNGVVAETVQSDLFENITSRYDLIVCNPPYLSAEDMNALQPEVAWEPALALCGGADGLDFYRRIAAAYKPRLAAGGTLLMEVGMGQAQTVGAMFDGAVQVIKDVAGIDRVVEVCA
jgi:release factor glutamine methyltransferase